MGLRVIAGSARNRVLAAPEGRETRPTGERVREAFFSMVQTRLPGSLFADLYAGSGAMGIEALSRGAAGAVFVDNAPKALRVLRENLKTAGLASLADVRHLDAPAGLGRLHRPENGYDIVFADPPYGFGDYAELLEALGRTRLVAPEGLVAIEHTIRTEMPEKAGDFVLEQTRRYGDSAMSIYLVETD
ncbi:MAG: 16S rRNA (guanine(966)-N(2))-methyltransferase RsmD [Candidatus Hydrogenedentota bacterium]